MCHGHAAAKLRLPFPPLFSFPLPLQRKSFAIRGTILSEHPVDVLSCSIHASSCIPWDGNLWTTPKRDISTISFRAKNKKKILKFASFFAVSFFTLSLSLSFFLSGITIVLFRGSWSYLSPPTWKNFFYAISYADPIAIVRHDSQVCV